MSMDTLCYISALCCASPTIQCYDVTYRSEQGRTGFSSGIGSSLPFATLLRIVLFSVRQVHYTCPLYVVKRDVVSIETLLFRGFWGSAVASHLVVNDCNAMPPHRGTPWASHGSILSPSVSPQPIRSDNGKGKAKGATPEPPLRGAAVRKAR